METGRIQVNVYTSRGKIPVADATVVIGRGDFDILALEVTNVSGQTGAIALPTPPMQQSNKPVKMLGYTTVNIWVEHPNFVRQRLENVQIFPNMDTIVPVELIPLGENQSSLVESTRQMMSVQDL